MLRVAQCRKLAGLAELNHRVHDVERSSLHFFVHPPQVLTDHAEEQELEAGQEVTTSTSAVKPRATGRGRGWT